MRHEGIIRLEVRLHSLWTSAPDEGN